MCDRHGDDGLVELHGAGIEGEVLQARHSSPPPHELEPHVPPTREVLTEGVGREPVVECLLRLPLGEQRVASQLQPLE